MEVRRDPVEKTISVEGKVVNSGERAIPGTWLVFHVIAPGGEEVSRERGAVEEDPFEPGPEFEFHWQMKDQPRAVEIRVSAEDNGDRAIPVDGPGPYTIE